ncbi:MAG: hypothetical protein ACXACY_27180 [Candidatus Hodarchaeales archaeon]|jgi:hypothetical protein
MKEKALDNINTNDAKSNVSDVKVFGNGDLWQLVCKASSEEQGWMKSTKVMEINEFNNNRVTGCLVHVSTQQRNPDGSYSIAEAVTYVEGAFLTKDKNGNLTLCDLFG